jgi:glutathione S-transferase
LHYAEGSLMPPLLLNLTFSELVKRSVFLVRPIVWIISQSIKSSYITPQIALHLNYLESELANSDWFVDSNFTAADIQMSFPIETAAERANLDASRPKLMNFLQRIHARPSYQRALERGNSGIDK